MTEDNGEEGEGSGSHDTELENRFTERELLEARIRATVAGDYSAVPLAVVSQAVAGAASADIADTDEIISLLIKGGAVGRSTQGPASGTTQVDLLPETRTTTRVSALALSELLSELDQQATQIEHQQEQLREQREDIEALREKLETIDRHLINNDPEY